MSSRTELLLGAEAGDRSLILLRRLTALSRAVAQTGSLDGILDLAARQAADMLGASRTVLMLVGDDGRAHTRAQYGVDPSVAAGLSGELDEALIERLKRALVEGAAHSFMAVPLIVQGEVTGLLAVARQGVAPWTPLDEATLAAVADQSASPIEIARLSEEVRQARLVQENARLYEAERAARAALDQERVRLVTVLENIPAGVVLLEAPSGSATFANPTAARLLGLADPAPGEVYQALLAGAGEAHPARRALVRGETVMGEEVEVVPRGGAPATFSVNAAPIRDGDGKVAAAVITFHDITRRRAVERHLEHVQRMEVVGRLAGGVAHEANNQMSVVLGAAAFILRRIDVSEVVRDDVKAIQRAAERTATVTAQLLAFSRRQIWRPQVLEADAVIRELTPVLRRTLGDLSGVEVRLEAPGAQVLLDRGQLEQTLLNLTMNARDAMPEGGELTLETRVVELGAQTPGAPPGVSTRPGTYLRLDLRDTGHGMDKETLGHLFEPFFTTKPVGQGTGLGLASVYGIVKQGHGYVWAASAPGQGATFTLHIPVVKEATAEPDATPPAGLALPGEVVLVVEDEPDVLRVTARALREAGYAVVEALNAMAALELVERHTDRLDLLLTDLAMPEMNGRELAEAVRQRYPGLPVLFMSGEASGGAAGHEAAVPGTMFLQKPFSPDGVAAQVRVLLDQQGR